MCSTPTSQRASATRRAPAAVRQAACRLPSSSAQRFVPTPPMERTEPCPPCPLRRLPDVRASDDCDGSLGARGSAARQAFHVRNDDVEQIAGTASVQCAHRDGFTETEALQGVHLALARGGIHFVGDDEDWNCCLAQ